MRKLIIALFLLYVPIYVFAIDKDVVREIAENGLPQSLKARVSGDVKLVVGREKYISDNQSSKIKVATFGIDKIEMEIDVNTIQLRSWYDYRDFKKRSKRSQIGKTDYIPYKPIQDASKMKATAINYFKSSDINRDNNLVFYELSGFDDKDGNWYFYWNRYIGEYEVPEEFVNIVIDDLTGEIFCFNDRTTTRICDIEIEIDEEQAKNTAFDNIEQFLSTYQVKRNDVLLSGTEKSNIVVRFPNSIPAKYIVAESNEKISYPKIDKSKKPLPEIENLPQPVLVYEIKMSFVFKKDKERNDGIRPTTYAVDVWISTKTGDIVGGQIF
jgi:hypothetical protein